jgi:hypothetical protein
MLTLLAMLKWIIRKLVEFLHLTSHKLWK